MVGDLLLKPGLYGPGLVGWCRVLLEHVVVLLHFLISYIIHPWLHGGPHDLKVLISSHLEAIRKEMGAHDTTLVENDSQNHHRCCEFGFYHNWDFLRIICDVRIILTVKFGLE